MVLTKPSPDGHLAGGTVIMPVSYHRIVETRKFRYSASYPLCFYLLARFRQLVGKTVEVRRFQTAGKTGLCSSRVVPSRGLSASESWVDRDRFETFSMPSSLQTTTPIRTLRYLFILKICLYARDV